MANIISQMNTNELRMQFEQLRGVIRDETVWWARLTGKAGAIQLCLILTTGFGIRQPCGCN